MPNKFIFFGTDSIAIPVLNELEKSGLMPVLIVCGEDKPKGRGLVLTPPATKLWAIERKIPVLQPKKLDEDFISTVSNFSFEYGIVASFGKIIPEAVLNLFPKGLLNVHPSLLPKLRGPSPIESTILYENTAGVTIIKLDKEMDHGPIVAQQEIKFENWPPKYSDAEAILGSAGGKLLIESLSDYLSGHIELKEQNHSEATFTKKIQKDEALINLSDEPTNLLKKIRAFEEWPTAFFFYETSKGKIRIKIKDAHIESDTLILDRIIPEGKGEMEWSDFKKGN
ncbi:MAG: methionyl-tRNA formyltransferase [Minisyncoccia bacterium]